MKSAEEQPVLRILESGAGGDVARLHRACFPEQHWRYTIFASPRVDRLIDALIDGPDHRFLGVYSHDELVAYEHIRRLEDRLHLNYVGVLPSHAGRGIGGALLKYLFSETRKSGLSRVSLDVLAENDKAVEWYRRNGFAAESATDSFIAARNNGAVALSPDICVWTEEQREREHMYGITEFDVAREHGNTRVGVIGELLYRVIGVGDQQLIDTLQVVDPAREVLMMLPAGEEPECEARLHSRTLRMSRSV